jgi:hypothetical protein
MWNVFGKHTLNAKMQIQYVAIYPACLGPKGCRIGIFPEFGQQGLKCTRINARKYETHISLFQCSASKLKVS